MLHESELARRTDGRIELRAGGLRVRWALAGLVTADGHTAVATFACTVRGLPDANEQKMLEEAMLSSRPVVASADLAEYFASCLGAAAQRHVRISNVESLWSDTGKQALAGALLEAGRALAFSSGVELLAPVQLDLDCPSWRRQQSEAYQHETARRRAAEHVDHLRRSAEILKQFQEIGAAATQLSPGQVLERIGAFDRADLLQSLLLASAKQSREARLWAVAGTSLIRVDGETPELIAMTEELGPLRSVRGDGSGGLLLGCRNGVLHLKADLKTSVAYRDPQATSPLGFNSAIIAGDRIWATHSDAGLVSWALDQAERPDIALRPDSATIPGFSPRNLSVLDGQKLALSSGQNVLRVNHQGEVESMSKPADSNVAAVFVQRQEILTVHDDGLLCRLDLVDLSLIEQRKLAGKVFGAAGLPWLADMRILLATDGPVVCAGTDDELLTQYCSAHLANRAVAGAAHAVAAIAADRQRLIVWHSWDGRRPCAEVHLYALARHRIADITFA